MIICRYKTIDAWADRSINLLVAGGLPDHYCPILHAGRDATGIAGRQGYAS